MPGSHFGSPLATVPFTDTKGYIALTAFALNLLVAVALTMALKVSGGEDHTSPSTSSTPRSADPPGRRNRSSRAGYQPVACPHDRRHTDPRRHR